MVLVVLVVVVVVVVGIQDSKPFGVKNVALLQAKYEEVGCAKQNKRPPEKVRQSAYMRELVEGLSNLGQSEGLRQSVQLGSDVGLQEVLAPSLPSLQTAVGPDLQELPEGPHNRQPNAPDRGFRRPPGQTDGHFASLLLIVLVSSWLHLQQVWGCSSRNLLLEAAGTVPPAHKHEGIIRIRLELCNQLPLQVALNLQTLLVVSGCKPWTVICVSVVLLVLLCWLLISRYTTSYFTIFPFLSARGGGSQARLVEVASLMVKASSSALLYCSWYPTCSPTISLGGCHWIRAVFPMVVLIIIIAQHYFLVVLVSDEWRAAAEMKQLVMRETWHREDGGGGVARMKLRGLLLSGDLYWSINQQELSQPLLHGKFQKTNQIK
ncbi:hypothetical protein EYF80_012296 [Liparis tanakae]|uniref:Uncharacterized protein n=1 Tax=Liparis tanakae TaxID=230148 RepID=A0A4Z2IJP1_9TELE|nr:hypothetical protein EYF80_012296 [Liparis tanakae]